MTYDGMKAAAERNAGIERAAAAAPDFIDAGMRAIRALPAGEYLGEDIRAALVARGIAPVRHQAWGALIRCAIARGVLCKTNEFRATTSVKTHRHPTQVLMKAA